MARLVITSPGCPLKPRGQAPHPGPGVLLAPKRRCQVQRQVETGPSAHPSSWYLSKGRGLPRRLVTTATQCWDARTYTLCWADCRTCSSWVSCSLERRTLMISGTCGW